MIQPAPQQMRSSAAARIRWTMASSGLRPHDPLPALLALVGVFLVASSWFPPAPLLVVILLVALLILTQRRGSGVVLVLGGLWAVDFGLRARGWLANEVLGSADLVLAGALLAWLVFGLHTIEGGARPGGPAPSPGNQPAEVDWAEGVLEGLRWAASAAAQIVLAVGAAAALLWLVPLPSGTSGRWGLAPSAWRYVILLWGLVLVGWVLSTLFSARQWRGLRPREARTYLYHVLGEQTERPRRMIIRRAARQRN